MKKISELKEERSRTVHFKDEYGNRVRDTEDVIITYQVKTVKTSTRFGHYFIDSIFFQILILTFQFLFGAAVILLREMGHNLSSLFLDYTYAVFLVLSYSIMYFVCESIWQKTPGKFLTNTIVIDEYGNKPSMKDLIARSLFRLVPFDAFSCIGDDYSYGWHDRWSNTYVVTNEELKKIRKLQEDPLNS